MTTPPGSAPESLSMHAALGGVVRSASYLNAFGFHRDPFPMAPDAQRFFHPKRVDNLLAEVTQAILTRKGLLLLTGGVGQGKTTLCHRLRHELAVNGHEVVLINNTFLQTDSLLEAIARPLGLNLSGQTIPQAMEALSQRLQKRDERGLLTTILIDDAQELSQDSLEMIRLLSNLEHNGQKLAQIILVGQEELEKKLADNAVRQVASRIVAHVVVAPFTYRESVAYIAFKLITAGCNDCLHLSWLAMRTLYWLTKGNPRRINVVMDRAIYAAFAHDHNQISSRLLYKVARESGLCTARPLRKWLLALMALVLLLWLGSRPEGAISAWNSVLAFWQTPVSSTAVPNPPADASTPLGVPMPEAMARFVRAYGLQEYGAAFHKSWIENRWEGVALQIENQTGLRLLQIANPPPGVRSRFPLLKLQGQRYLLFWRPTAQTMTGIQGWESGFVLQRLHALGRLPTVATLDEARAALRLFQQQHNLAATGEADDGTLFLLTYLE